MLLEIVAEQIDSFNAAAETKNNWKKFSSGEGRGINFETESTI